MRYEAERAAMGTRIRIVAWAAPDAGRAQAALESALERVASIERAVSDWLPGSPARRLGERVGARVPLDPDLLEVLRHSERAHRLTGGAFDPTVGPWTRLWRRAARQGRLPDAAELEAARASIGWEHVELDLEAGTVRVARPGMGFDFGGIAKGWAADEALEVLAEHGLTVALVDAGGDVAVRGVPPGSSGWRVAVGEAGPVLVLTGGAGATSGDTHRALVHAGTRYGHVLDPRTGRGVTTGVQATVLAPEGALADALASALCVTGPDGLEWIERLPEVEAEVRVRLPSGQLGPPRRSAGYATRLR